MTQPGAAGPTLIRTMMTGAIDYAGLFPPAGLTLANAVRNFDAYRASPHAWMLGRFIVPVDQLDNLVAYLPWDEKAGWRISVLAKPSDAPRLIEFNEKHGMRARIDSVETAVANAREVVSLSPLWSTFMVFAEVSVAADPTSVIAALAAQGLRAKVRTGGVTPSAFPAPPQVARFIVACTKAKVAFKATAGLHHAIRAEYPLTYEAGCARAEMFGFTNMILATAFAGSGATASEVSEVLSARDEMVKPDGVSLPRGKKVSESDIARTRKSGMLSFGSCSFEEPVSELQQRGLL